jgi:hypothetical protein
MPARSQLQSAAEVLADVLDHDGADGDYAALYVFGEQHYEGGASPLLCIDSTNGEVHGLDIDWRSSSTRKSPPSSRHFEALDRALRLRTLAVSALPHELSASDPSGFPRSDWRNFLEWVADGLLER